MSAQVLSQLDAEAQKTVAKYDQKRAAVLPLLHMAQDKIGYVSLDAEAWVAQWTEVPVVHVREVLVDSTKPSRRFVDSSMEIDARANHSGRNEP